MLKWYPMARATSKLGGRPVLFDLTKISYHVLTTPDFQPIVRDLETVRYKLRRKSFGTRPSAELAFEVPHSRTLNSLARWYEIDGLNLLQNPYDLTVAPWSLSNASSAFSPAKDPKGTFTATRLTDASGAAIGLLLQNTGKPAANFQGRFSLWVRADVPHVMSIGIQDNVAEATDLDVNTEFGWTRVEVRRSFTNAAANFQAMIRPTQLSAALQGVVDLYVPDVRRIVAMPGTDEEILADLKDKASSDDWTIEISLDGGLTFRECLLQQHQKLQIEDKWVGHVERWTFVGADVIFRVPAQLDGHW